MVRSQFRELVRSTGGPTNLDIGFGSAVKAEVDSKVVLREVTATAANLVNLDERLGVGSGLR